MKLSNYVDPVRCFQLVSGVVGIYISYLVTGVIHESMLKKEYTNDYTNAEEKFTWAEGFLIFPCGICWLIGELLNHYQIRKEDRTEIPAKNAAICGVTVAISTLTYTYAIYLTNFPVVMMFKSCNILSVILVGVLCSRVKDKKLKLGTKKILVGVLVTLGIVAFKWFDPEAGKKEEKKTEIAGIVLLLVSLMADGFLPDFQAQIKTKYKPLPMEMMTIINKWVTIIALAYSILLGQLFGMCSYIATHHLFLIHMASMGILSTAGQIFVYRMIKQFKQHFVPFVITTRKIFTVALSIVFYGHETNAVQIGGIITVFAIVTYEFVSELMGEKDQVEAGSSATLESQRTNQLAVAQPQVEPPSRSVEVSMSREGGEDIGRQEEEIYKQRLAGEHSPAFQTQPEAAQVEQPEPADLLDDPPK